MKFEKILSELKERKIHYDYLEEDELVSIDFIWRGLTYHIWEFPEEDGSLGCETNIFTTGRTVELHGDYLTEILNELKNWPYME